MWVPFIQDLPPHQEPKIALAVFPDISYLVAWDIHLPKRGGVVGRKLFSERIKEIKAFTGFYPEFIFRAFQDTRDEIINEGVAILWVMTEYFELVTIIAVEAAHGTRPEKSSFVFIKAIDLVIGETVADIQPGKSVLGCLRKNNGRHPHTASQAEVSKQCHTQIYTY